MNGRGVIMGELYWPCGVTKLDTAGVSCSKPVQQSLWCGHDQCEASPYQWAHVGFVADFRFLIKEIKSLSAFTIFSNPFSSHHSRFALLGKIFSLSFIWAQFSLYYSFKRFIFTLFAFYVSLNILFQTSNPIIFIKSYT